MNNLNNIKLVCLDLDGVLCDGMYIVSETGDISKSFYTRDWWAIQELQEAGISVAIVTHCYDNCIDKKIERLPGKCKMKLSLHKLPWDITKEQYLEQRLNVPWEQTAFMGDSENDLEAMKRCGFTGCPADAVSIIKEESNFIASSPGGKGAVCEFVKYIIDCRKAENVNQCDGKDNKDTYAKPNASG